MVAGCLISGRVFKCVACGAMLPVACECGSAVWRSLPLFARAAVTAVSVNACFTAVPHSKIASVKQQLQR